MNHRSHDAPPPPSPRHLDAAHLRQYLLAFLEATVGGLDHFEALEAGVERLERVRRDGSSKSLERGGWWGSNRNEVDEKAVDGVGEDDRLLLLLVLEALRRLGGPLDGREGLEVVDVDVVQVDKIVDGLVRLVVVENRLKGRRLLVRLDDVLDLGLKLAVDLKLKSKRARVKFQVVKEVDTGTHALRSHNGLEALAFGLALLRLKGPHVGLGREMRDGRTSVSC